MQKNDIEDFILRIKTLDNQVFEFKVNQNMKIEQIKQLVFKKLQIPENQQNLIFFGKILSNEQTLQQCKIKKGTTINLIAKSESQNIDSNNSSPNQTENQTSNNQQANISSNNDRSYEMGIINNVLRTLGESSIDRRNYRRKLMQQRTFGFFVNQRESLEIIDQNLNTNKQLMQARSENGKPFNFENRKLYLGQWIDVKDTIDQWLEAEVIDINLSTKKVFVHYNGWGTRWDEWINISSPRIAPFRTHTVQNGYAMYLSPVPQNSLDGDSSNLQNPNPNLQKIVQNVSEQIEELSEMFQKLTALNKMHIQEQKRLKFAKKEINIQKMKIQRKKKQNKKIKEPMKQFDNMSVKIPHKIQEDVLNDDEISMKSLHITKNKSQKKKNRLLQSPRSLKSNNTQNSNLLKDEEIQQIIEEDEQSISSQVIKAKNQEIIDKARQKEMSQLCQQLSPLVDRLGRAMIDIAPHIAMLAVDLNPNLVSQQTTTFSTATFNGSIQSQVNIGIFNRFAQNPTPEPNFFQQNFSYQQNYQQTITKNALNSEKPLYFQIPVILNPGELLSIGNTSHPFLGEGNVNLHINAIVKKTNQKCFSIGTQTKKQQNNKISKNDQYNSEDDEIEQIIQYNSINIEKDCNINL